MFYKFRMIGTYLSKVDICDSKGNWGPVMLTEQHYLRVTASGNTREEACHNAVNSTDNCRGFQDLGPIPRTMTIPPNAHLYATQEQIQIAMERMPYLEKPKTWRLLPESLIGDPVNQEAENTRKVYLSDDDEETENPTRVYLNDDDFEEDEDLDIRKGGWMRKLRKRRKF